MVFEKITIFEPHLEGARFGPTFGERDESPDEEPQESPEMAEHESEPGGRSRVRTLAVAAVAVSLVATMLARRYMGGDDYEVEQVELDESMGDSIEEPAE